ncbi:hypothetical protein BOX15_Mlig013209g1, partial [Macrostomum lignano]
AIATAPARMYSTDKPAFSVEVCKESEIGDGSPGMKQVKFGEFPVLVGRTADADRRLFAIGGKCPHFGLPLAGGQIAGQRLRCPFHGACFNLVSGDIEESPGMDCLPTFKVSVRASDQMVLVEGTPPADGKFVVQRPLAGYQPEFASEHFVIVGGGPAAAAAADSLRQEGYRGKLTVLSADSVPPFDRTKLSKAMAAEPALLRTAEHYAQHDIELMLESRVESVDPAQRTVEFQSKNGRVVLPYTKLLVCSGSSARQMAVDTPQRGVFYLRSPDDSKRIHAAGQGADAVLIGSSFIALESAAYLVANGAKSVTVLARDPVPFKALFGEEAGKAARRLHESKGVKFVIGELQSFASDAQGGLSGLKLKSGDTLPAQLCVVGIGSTPNTAFLPAGLLAGGKPGSPLVVGPDLRSPSDSNVFGAGDVLGYGHWQTAQTQGRLAARSMLGKPVRQPLATFFWTLMFGTGFRYTALAAGGDGRPSSPWKRAVVAEPKEEFKFMTYLVGEADQVVAGVAVGAGPAPVVLANLLEKGQPVDLKSLV